jgi:peptide-methionine (R)-S-oxide reductase
MKPVDARQITRRSLWIAPVGLAGAAIVVIRNQNRIGDLPDAVTDSEADREVTVARFDDTGAGLGMVRASRVIRSNDEWRAALSPQQYSVTRQRQTDPAFTGTFFQAHARGLFRCIACGEALFSSDAKYDSGTGWPSFWAPIAKENLRTRPEPGVTLASGIEVICARCGAHLGHVFNDGPKPTHLRYCINESSLRFVARTKANS